MKKRIISIVCVLALCLALPTLAWAAGSPVVQSSTVTSNGVSMKATATAGTALNGATSSTNASNASVSGSQVILASFELTGDATDVTVTFTVPSQYANKAFKVFIQHNDGTTETREGYVDSASKITINVSKLSIFTVSVDPSSTNTNANTSSTSQQTGAPSTTPVVLGTLVALLGAGAVAFALRKKVNQ
ncbi:MAG: hypothetical protein LBR39_04915 [Coriobacteriales bacterium]|jgi:hypothetical protein|nr:hypothetical protein [Coriobacteriales bacterium]